PIRAAPGVPAGVLWVYGSGQSRFFQGPVGGPFQSPPNDFGTLVQAPAGGPYTYTAKDDTEWLFDSLGRLISIVDPHSQPSLFFAGFFTYTDGTATSPPATVTEPDGGVATFNYSGGLLSSISEPGGRTVTLTHNGAGELTAIQEPDQGVRTLTYD